MRWYGSETKSLCLVGPLKNALAGDVTFSPCRNCFGRKMTTTVKVAKSSVTVVFAELALGGKRVGIAGSQGVG